MNQPASTILTRWGTWIALVLALLGATGAPARADRILTATASANLNQGSTLGTLDLDTGQFTATTTLPITVVGLSAAGDGTFYASATDGNLYRVDSSGNTTQFGSAAAPVPPGGGQLGFFGLAATGSGSGSGGLYATSNNAPAGNSGAPITLNQISPDGNQITALGTLNQAFLLSSGSLTLGPGGSLYFESLDAASNPALFRVDPASGTAAEVGAGQGPAAPNLLTLVTAENQLYGIDTATHAGAGPINIYTLDTTTGLATPTGVVVTGLAAGQTLDTAAATPEPSTLVLGLMGVVCCAWLGVRHRHQHRA